MIGYLLLIGFLFCGCVAADALLRKSCGAIRLWFGLVIGLIMMMWSPIPFAFALRFTKAAQLLGLGVSTLTAAGCAFAMRGKERARGAFFGDMPIGMVLALLILFGVLQRVLDRMALTDRQALLLVALIFVGGWLPDIRLGMVSVNIGGALVPLGVCVYLFFHAGTGRERIRCLVASVLTAAVIDVISLLFPADPVAMPFDPMVLYGLCGGVIAWLTGRSRRSAFIAGVLGMILADTAIGVVNWTRGVQQVLYLGSAGALDAVVLSGVTAVMLCELFGEIMERMARGKTDGSTLQGGQSA